jgi:DNA mismatch endonuclease, patch repair protein
MVDNLTPLQRSYTMSRMRSKDTTPELTVRKLVHASGLRYRKHVVWLPGKPDLVFIRAKVVVFVDGDFFHGWRFTSWKHKLAPYWQAKIESNRQRDRRNVGRLRRDGWLVIRIWQHELKSNTTACVDRIQTAVLSRLTPDTSRCR